jgi:[ribosomal protein S18]-alanine N-acetyltransferase
MIAFLKRLFGRAEPVLSEASVRDASALAVIHAASFQRGWSESEFEQLLADRTVVAQRAAVGRRIAGFILSRLAADEAEILSVAVGNRHRGRGLGRRLLDLHLRRLAAMGTQAVFLEVEETNTAALRLYEHAGFHEVGRRDGYYPRDDGEAAAALVLRRDIA